MIHSTPRESGQASVQPSLTVAVCTLNRAKDLTTCLEYLGQQNSGPDDFEVLVVDNGPHEATRAVVEACSSGTFAVRYTVEPIKGTTYARRRAWLLARGDLVAYIDDDAAPSPNWVNAIIAAFANSDERLAALGGPVNNVVSMAPPLPFTEAPGPGGLDFGLEFKVLSAAENLWGGNIAFRRSALALVDAHGEPIGPIGSRPGANEDILIQHQLEAAGFVRGYDPAMQIVHNSWRADASSRQIRRLAFWTGVDDALMARILSEPPMRERFAMLRHRLGRLRAQSAAAVRARQALDTQGTETAVRAALRSAGYIRGLAWPVNLNFTKDSAPLEGGSTIDL